MVPCYGMEIQPISVLSILYPTTLVNSFLVKFTFGVFFVVKLLSHVQLFVTPWTAACQASLSFTSPRACSNSCLLSRWCHPPISSSVVPFSSCLQSFPASGSFPVRQFFPLSCLMGVARTLPDLHDLGVSVCTLWALLLCCADSCGSAKSNPVGRLLATIGWCWFPGLLSCGGLG